MSAALPYITAIQYQSGAPDPSCSATCGACGAPCRPTPNPSMAGCAQCLSKRLAELLVAKVPPYRATITRNRVARWLHHLCESQRAEQHLRALCVRNEP